MRTCLSIVLALRDILWPATPPANGAAVKNRLFRFLSDKLEQTIQSARDAYLVTFIEHAIKVSRNYAEGLFHCYNDARIPQTNNLLENRNGMAKMNLRRCSGRTSTASGPGTSYGGYYMYAIVLNGIFSREELEAIMTSSRAERYLEAREELNQTRQSASIRRAYLRNPQKYLQQCLERLGK